MASVTKRGNGYTIRVSLGYDITGKQIQKFMTWKPAPGMTQKQVEKELERQKILFEEKCRSGQTFGGAIRFADFIDYWKKEYAEKNLRATTLSGYNEMLDRIVRAMGHIRLERIQPHQLSEFYAMLQAEGVRKDVKYIPKIDFAKLLKRIGMTQTVFAQRAGVSVSVIKSVISGRNVIYTSAKKIALFLERDTFDLFDQAEPEKSTLSNKTVLHYHRLISSILEKAVKWQVIRDNPCRRVELPKVEKKEARYLDDIEAERLLACLDKEPLQYRTAITLLLYSGMRRGELCGLEWQDIDFDNSLIDINKSSLYLSGKGIFNDETKTDSSHRVIKVPPNVIELLRLHKREQNEVRMLTGSKWVNSGKIFVQWNGKPLHPDTLTGWFKKFIRKYNLPDISLHSLRHTNATLLIANGVNIRTVASRLGHANMTTTSNIYTHAIKTADEKAADLLENALNFNKKVQ